MSIEPLRRDVDERFVEMTSLAYKTIRGAILGLMVILAAVSTGYCDTYDADPYDDVPPVTLELNFVVPAVAGAAHAQIGVSSAPPLLQRRDTAQNFLTSVASAHPDAAPVSAIATLPVLLPLRT